MKKILLSMYVSALVFSFKVDNLLLDVLFVQARIRNPP